MDMYKRTLVYPSRSDVPLVYVSQMAVAGAWCSSMRAADSPPRSALDATATKQTSVSDAPSHAHPKFSAADFGNQAFLTGEILSFLVSDLHALTA